jgi:hypothetical protein
MRRAACVFVLAALGWLVAGAEPVAAQNRYKGTISYSHGSYGAHSGGYGAYRGGYSAYRGSYRTARRLPARAFGTRGFGHAGFGYSRFAGFSSGFHGGFAVGYPLAAYPVFAAPVVYHTPPPPPPVVIVIASQQGWSPTRVLADEDSRVIGMGVPKWAAPQATEPLGDVARRYRAQAAQRKAAAQAAAALE